MSNVRSVSRDLELHDLDDSGERTRLRRLAALFDEVTFRMVSLRARVAAASPEEAACLRVELVQLEDDWRCLASAQTFAAGFARAG